MTTSGQGSRRERPGPPASGEELFARYAYPPNALGYCGPNDGGRLLQESAAKAARAFEGAWPYLEFIAHHTGYDPLDPEVVEAYWLGTALLDEIDLAEYGADLLDRLRRRAGPAMRIPSSVAPGARCDHTFHCFTIYPWMSLLAAGRGGDHPRAVLDRCRIRWGEVVGSDGDRVEVRSRLLTWDGRQLGLGEPVSETAFTAGDALVAGDLVALHWDWVCARVDHWRIDNLHRATLRQLSITNHLTSRGIGTTLPE